MANKEITVSVRLPLAARLRLKWDVFWLRFGIGDVQRTIDRAAGSLEVGKMEADRG